MNPLTETTFYILLSLAPAPRHGYAILKDVESLSEGRITLSTGTLYGAIKRLLDTGWIVLEEAEAGGRERKTYRLTEDGQRVLTAEAERLRRLYGVAQQRLQGGEA